VNNSKGRISLRKQSSSSQILAVKGSAGQTVRVPSDGPPGTVGLGFDVHDDLLKGAILNLILGDLSDRFSRSNILVLQLGNK